MFNTKKDVLNNFEEPNSCYYGQWGNINSILQYIFSNIFIFGLTNILSQVWLGDVVEKNFFITHYLNKTTTINLCLTIKYQCIFN